MPAIAAIRVEYMPTNTAHDFYSPAWIGGAGAPVMDCVGVVRGHGPLLQGGGFLVTCRDAPLL